MNKIHLIGRLTRDPEIRYSTNEMNTAVGSFTLAVKRTDKHGGADFFNCVAFGKQAEIFNQYVFKGHQVSIVGRVQIEDYTDKNTLQVRKITKVIVEEVEFLQNKEKSENNINNNEDEMVQDFLTGDELPF